MQIQVACRILTVQNHMLVLGCILIDEIEARRVPVGKRLGNRVLFFPIERTIHHRRRRRSSLPKIDQSKRRKAPARVG